MNESDKVQALTDLEYRGHGLMSIHYIPTNFGKHVDSSYNRHLTWMFAGWG